MSYARVKEEGTVGYSVRKVFRVSGSDGIPLRGPKGYETIRLGPFGHPETPGITWELRIQGRGKHGHTQASVYLVPVEFPEGLELETSYTVVVTEVERAGLCVFSKGHGGAGWDEFSGVKKICFEKTSCGCGCGAETRGFLCCTSSGTCAKDKTRTFKGPVKVEVTVEYRYEKPTHDKLPFADWLFSDLLADMDVKYSHSEPPIRAHSIVLASASPVLKELIQTKPKGRDFDCSPATLGGERCEEAVRAMLRFAYTGFVGDVGSLCLAQLDDLSCLSQYLKIEELSAACEKQLVTRLTEDFAQTALRAHEKGLTAVLRAAEAMVAEKKVGIPKSQWAIVLRKNTDLFASLSGLHLAD